MIYIRMTVNSSFGSQMTAWNHSFNQQPVSTKAANEVNQTSMDHSHKLSTHNISSDWSIKHQAVSRAWDHPNLGFVNKWPWLRAKDTGLFLFSEGSVQLHFQLIGGLTTPSKS